MYFVVRLDAFCTTYHGTELPAGKSFGSQKSGAIGQIRQPSNPSSSESLTPVCAQTRTLNSFVISFRECYGLYNFLPPDILINLLVDQIINASLSHNIDPAPGYLLISTSDSSGLYSISPNVTAVMALGEEKADDASAKNTTQQVPKEGKGDMAIQQGPSEAGLEKQQSDQIDPQHGENSHDQGETDLKSDGKQEQQAEPTMAKAASTTSATSKTLELIPRSDRRGLFARFTIIPEVTNPYDYKDNTKWMMTIIVSLAATTSSTGSSIFYRECQN